MLRHLPIGLILFFTTPTVEAQIDSLYRKQQSEAANEKQLCFLLAYNASYEVNKIGPNFRSRRSRNLLSGHYIDNEQKIFKVLAMDNIQGSRCDYSYVGILNKEVILDTWLTFWKIENGNLTKYEKHPQTGEVFRSEYPKLY